MRVGCPGLREVQPARSDEGTHNNTMRSASRSGAGRSLARQSTPSLASSPLVPSGRRRAAEPASGLQQQASHHEWSGSVRSQRGQAAHAVPVAGAPTATQPEVATIAAAKDDFATDKRPVILYDGVCNLCNGAVDFMLENDGPGKFRMAALQSEAGKRLLRRSGRRPDDISSIVLVDERAAHIRSEAILRIAAGISQPWAFLAIFGFPVPLPFRDAVYDLVANNRYSFLGKRDVCRLSNAGFEDRFIVD